MVESTQRAKNFSNESLSDVALAEAGIKLAFGEHSSYFEPNPKNSSFQISVRCLKKIKLYRGRYERAFRLHSPNSIEYMQSFPIRGNGQHLINGKRAARHAAPFV
jgi:hypothetical protein